MRVTLSHLLSVHELMILIIEHGVYANSDFEYLPQLKMERFFFKRYNDFKSKCFF